MTLKAKKGKRKKQKAGLNKSILDVGMGMLRAAIQYKVADRNILLPGIAIKQRLKCCQQSHNLFDY